MRYLPSGLLDRLIAPAPDPQRVGWLREHEYAHRGLHGPGIPENSLTAFAAALGRGMGIECDVQLSADGKAMVFHDWELDRLTGETGQVVDRTSAELARLELIGSADTIPALGDLLDLVDGGQPLLIEVKSRRDYDPIPLCRSVHESLEAYQGPHAVMSFDPRVARWFMRHKTKAARETLRGLIVTEEHMPAISKGARLHGALWLARPDFLAYDVRDFPSHFATSQRKRGLPVLTWTVRTPALREVAGQNADAPIAEGAGIATIPQ
jgi:glycerophosphoryl diester phosphodiesterase